MTLLLSLVEDTDFVDLLRRLCDLERREDWDDWGLMRCDGSDIDMVRDWVLVIVWLAILFLL
jgi:hypothetical protein